MPLRSVSEMKNEIAAATRPTTNVSRYWLICSTPMRGNVIAFGVGIAAFDASINTPATAAETLKVT